MNVVKDASGDDRVERPGLVEILQGDATEDRSLGSIRVNCQDVVACGGKRGRDAAFVSAADLQDPPWGTG
jgi:hypothetical protein